MNISRGPPAGAGTPGIGGCAEGVGGRPTGAVERCGRRSRRHFLGAAGCRDAVGAAWALRIRHPYDLVGAGKHALQIHIGQVRSPDDVRDHRHQQIALLAIRRLAAEQPPKNREVDQAGNAVERFRVLILGEAGKDVHFALAQPDLSFAALLSK